MLLLGLGGGLGCVEEKKKKKKGQSQQREEASDRDNKPTILAKLYLPAGMYGPRTPQGEPLYVGVAVPRERPAGIRPEVPWEDPETEVDVVRTLQPPR